MATETVAVADEPGETATEAAEPAAVVAEPATAAQLATTQDPWPSSTAVDTSGSSAQALAAALAAVSGV